MRARKLYFKIFPFIFKATLFDAQLPDRLPQLWDLILPSALKNATKQDTIQEEEGNQLIFGLQVLEIMTPSLAKSLLPPALKCLPRLCNLLAHPYKAVRHMASRCIATLATLNTEKVILKLYQTDINITIDIKKIKNNFF